MHGGLYETILKKSSRSFHFACWDKRPILWKNLVCRLKNEIPDVSVSTIILRTDDKKLNGKGMEVNLHLKELSKEKNISLIDSSRKIKAQHLNKGKLHLTKYGSRILSNNFVNEIFKVLHWQIDRGNSNAIV